MKQICKDLDAQYQEFDDLVKGLDEPQWYRSTPFFEWTIFDQVAHIAFFDHEALLAIEDLDQFQERAKGLMEVIMSGGSLRAHTNPLLGSKEPEALLTLWRSIRSRLLHRLQRMAVKDRLSWYGPDMSARSFATARLMETWAHSQDVFDALGIKRVNREGLFHVAHIGVSTFGWSFVARNLQAPDIKPRVELSGPAGEQWEWGDPASKERVWGSAEDFCLAVTQRRNAADTGLKWQGEIVAKWLAIAQAFAGEPQDPPPPGVRVVRL
ncbi:MAG: TIGR03084 family protein [Deltaproteobacteria bacterium]|nr:TIGR03084 family protein [Deltaproteobacteria bacterium]MBW2199584.1 TIGR03084 family protein [Deltaproteobacteria bacterium]MBW2539110.1 TIGR03084 family protein [Deltaproteobacteria bacterium]